MSSPVAGPEPSSRYRPPATELRDAEDARSTGRAIVRSVALGAVLVSATVVVTLNLVHGSGHLPIQLLRFALMCALAYFLLRGSRAARAFAVALFGISGLIGLVAYLVFMATIAYQLWRLWQHHVTGKRELAWVVRALTFVYVLYWSFGTFDYNFADTELIILHGFHWSIIAALATQLIKETDPEPDPDAAAAG